MRRLILCAALIAIGGCTPPAGAPETPPVAERAAATFATVTAPQEGATVTSPLRVSGVAPADWFFENQFPVRLIDAQGAEIASAPAHPRINWTEPGPKEFDAELSFTATGPAILVLQEDMPGEGETPREVRVQLVLAGE